MAKQNSYPVLDNVKSSDKALFYRDSEGTVQIPFSVFASLLGDNFLALTDTPGTYVGQIGKTLAVNSNEDGLVFVENTLSPTLITLPDTPSSFGTAAGKLLKVNNAEDAVEFTDHTFLDNSDTPNAYTGLAGSLLRVNNAETALEFFPDTGDIPNVILVNDESKLPDVNGAGEHELTAGTAYWFTGSFSLTNPIRFISKGSVIFGNASNQTVISYNGTGAAIRATTGAAIRIEALRINTNTGSCMEYTGGGGAGSGDFVSMTRTLLSAPSDNAATFDNIDQFVVDTCSFQGAQPLVLNGADVGLFDAVNSLFLAFAANPCLDLGTSVTTTMAIAGCSLQGIPGATGISGLPNNANLSASGSARVTSTNVGDSLTPLAGITTEDTKWRFNNNVNIPDSLSIAFAYISSPLTTSIVASDTDYQVNGVWAAQADTERATVSASGEIEFFNIEETKGPVNCTFTATKVGGGTGIYTFKVQKNPNGAGWSDIEAISKTVTLSSTTASVTLMGISKHVENDQFRLVVRGVGTADDVNVAVTQLVIG